MVRAVCTQFGFDWTRFRISRSKLHIYENEKNRQNITSCARIVQKVYFENENENKYENVSDLIIAKCCVLRRAAAMRSAHTRWCAWRVCMCQSKLWRKAKINCSFVALTKSIHETNIFCHFNCRSDCKRKQIDALPIGLRICWSSTEWNGMIVWKWFSYWVNGSGERIAPRFDDWKGIRQKNEDSAEIKFNVIGFVW